MFDFKSGDYPKGPGVYLMHDAKGRVIYVGKAKSLVKRLASYFRSMERHTPKTRMLVARIARIETLSTATEKEALLLEASLIKKHRPRYNIVLRDDKSYVLFRLTKAHDYPRLTMTRRVVRDGSVYYGPFTSSLAARRTWKVLGKAFPLRKCGDRTFTNRIRPCLYHHIGQCLAPCVGLADAKAYAALVRRVEMFLAGRAGDVVGQLTREMQDASQQMEFERAAEFRDQIRAIEATVERQAVVLPKPVDLDVLAVAEGRGGLGLGLLFVRQGRLLDGRSYHFPGLGLEDAPEAVSGFLTQYYWASRFIPERLLLPWALDDAETLESALAERRGGPVRLGVPRGGPEKQILDMARANAAQARPEAAAGQDVPERLKRALHLSAEPHRVECVDVSHLGGKGMRAGLVVFEGGVPFRDDYRTYTFPELEGSGDDYAALADWARRRAEAGPPWPDLLLIDGGRGQIAAVSAGLEQAGALDEFPLAGIAKSIGDGSGPDRRAGALTDRIFLPARSNPLPLKPGSPELLFLQRVRDEAHRFIIGRQRKSRKKTMISSELESLPGIGPKTARLLWDSFGSLEAMRAASLKDLLGVSGLGKKRAEKVHQALQSLGGGN
ncbi:excinuclease ABC subunit UvrC [Desulfovibrio ferrophilus]|nr:excinuclease ABC subunit UvrC [Desulfovibrio ferrophilus]